MANLTGKMRIAFYRSRSGNWVDGGINMATGFRGFSHSELVFPDGWCFSSTQRVVPGDTMVDSKGRPKKNGTRWKKIDFNPDHWKVYDFYPQPSPEAIDSMRCFCNSVLDAGYDWWGCLRFVLFFVRQSWKDYFCSEVDTEACHQSDNFNNLEPAAASPNRLEKQCAKNFVEMDWSSYMATTNPS